MTGDPEPQQVEIIGSTGSSVKLYVLAWRPADPVRNDGLDLLVSPPDYSRTQPVQIKTHRDRTINV